MAVQLGLIDLAGPGYGLAYGLLFFAFGNLVPFSTTPRVSDDAIIDSLTPFEDSITLAMASNSTGPNAWNYLLKRAFLSFSVISFYLLTANIRRCGSIFFGS